MKSLALDIIISGGLLNCGKCLDLILIDLQILKEEVTEPIEDPSVESLCEKNRIFIIVYHPPIGGFHKKNIATILLIH